MCAVGIYICICVYLVRLLWGRYIVISVNRAVFQFQCFHVYWTIDN